MKTSEKLYELSQRVAESSRFYFDEKIQKSKVYEMYNIWLEKSVTKEMASDVLI
ncbi:hypothetical protein [Salinimicrobium soli]|uniref:hypothetical protein n=1 Tax=Salinimicrobium soli TaxID=1254399 RepID=UPI003AAB84FA